ncbi:MAG: alanine racemase [Clostridia bacterium]|nr:alanine racemase [Clostridia bacterium]
MQLKGEQKRVWAEIDLDAVEWNFNVVKNFAAKNSKICCVVKANGYGHGAVTLAKFYEKLGADCFAVSNIEEALQLREAGIKFPILVLGYTPVECAALLSRYDISQCVYSLAYGELLAQEAKKAGVKIKVHIKIDTGMGRLGFSCRGEQEKELEDAYAVCRFSEFETEGIFTHFAVSDEGEKGKTFTRQQGEDFCRAIQFLKEKGVRFSLVHCANSAAIFDYPELQMDMVRAGIILYGIAPSYEVGIQEMLRPVMTLKAVISSVKTLKKGESVSYGRTFIADKEMRIATIPIGYADGFWRSNSSVGAKVFFRGRLLTILGRICMDQLMIDLQDLQDVQIGEEVVIFGAEKGAMTVEEIAQRNSTISYEILCALGERVPRVYTYQGKIVSILDNIFNKG